jgi:hypothetical protein
MSSLNLKLTSFHAVPPDMERLSEIAAERGLTTSAFLRQMIARTVRRESGKRKAA